MIHKSASVHPSVIVEENVEIGENAVIWHFSHLRESAKIAPSVSLGRDVYVDRGVEIGRGSRVQNGVSIYSGVNVESWCFIGPHVTFTNDLYPRVGKKSWKMEETYLRSGMSIGAGAVIRCGVEIGSFALVGAGAIVTKDIPMFTLAYGHPAKVESRICACGQTRLPLEAFGASLIQDCCRHLLDANVLELAISLAENAPPLPKDLD